jgi:ABC-2 type transport system permease protein
MNKIFLIIKREYLSKVRKRSFVIMTILGPLLMASVFVFTIYLATRQDEKILIQVKDDTGMFFSKFENNQNYTFVEITGDLEATKDTLKKRGDYMLLHIPATKVAIPDKAVIYSDQQPTMNLREYISSRMSKELEKQKLSAEIRKEILLNTPGYKPGADTSAQDLMSETILKNIHTDVNITTIKTDEGGGEKKSFTEVAMGVGYIASLLIYMFIFLYGAQVMRGVIEEKTSRIVEVLVSSVKPFQLMMGKVVGIALVGLTQFLLWILFTFLIITAIQTAMPEKFAKANPQTQINQGVTMPNQDAITKEIPQDSNGSMFADVTDGLAFINITQLLICFILYFLFGYLLYGALFAAIGAAVDNETDTQQFMLPVTIPLILGLVVAQTVIQNPASPLAFWLSMIPFTSPIVMIVRIPFGVPLEQIILSLSILVIGFFGTTWLAAKIYRTGILMYGKKSNYRELWKWIRYKG